MSKKRKSADSDSSSDSSSSDSEVEKSQKKTKKDTNTPVNDELVLHPMFDYLDKWKNDRGNWKFVTNKQTQLIKNCFNDVFFPAKYFKMFLEYIVPMKSNARRLLFETSKHIIRREKLKAKEEAIDFAKIGGDMDKFLEKELEGNKRYARAKIVYDVILASESGETLGEESCVSD
ncbi:hypothetical protein AKO1_012504 [Acrasis kona]|uniref:WKF domain-containing protein n=1 Tax=Acrasis kona TaxID=1008807 RepID=A0AAW2YWX7_9EUKA